MVKTWCLILSYSAFTISQKGKRVLIQPSERRRNQITNKSCAQSEKYSPLWKCSKLFIPPQTDGMIRFSFNIGCSVSKIVKSKRAFREANVPTLSISFSHSQNSLSDKQTQSTPRKVRLEPATRDAQKLAQNVFSPWRSDAELMD